MHYRSTLSLNTLVTPPAFLHITRITNTKIRSRANTILTAIGTMRHTSITIRTCRICYIPLPTSTLIGPCTFAIQTGVATVCLTSGSRLIQSPACFTGALVWCCANAVLAALGATGHASFILEGVTLLARALVGADASAPGTAALTEVFAFMGAWIFYESVD